MKLYLDLCNKGQKLAMPTYDVGDYFDNLFKFVLL